MGIAVSDILVMLQYSSLHPLGMSWNESVFRLFSKHDGATSWNVFVYENWQGFRPNDCLYVCHVWFDGQHASKFVYLVGEFWSQIRGRQDWYALVASGRTCSLERFQRFSWWRSERNIKWHARSNIYNLKLYNQSHRLLRHLSNFEVTYWFSTFDKLSAKFPATFQEIRKRPPTFKI